MTEDILRVVGLFRELDPLISSAAPSIFEANNLLDPDVACTVSTYLRSGVVVFDVMGATADPFDPANYISGGPSLMTDGQWIWRRDLPFLVEKYRLGLNAKFVAFAQEQVLVPAEKQAILEAEWETVVDDYYRAAKGIGR